MDFLGFDGQKGQLQVNAARVSHFLDAETCAFSQVPSLSMGVHGTLNLFKDGTLILG